MPPSPIAFPKCPIFPHSMTAHENTTFSLEIHSRSGGLVNTVIILYDDSDSKKFVATLRSIAPRYPRHLS